MIETNYKEMSYEWMEKSILKLNKDGVVNNLSPISRQYEWEEDLCTWSISDDIEALETGIIKSDEEFYPKDVWPETTTVYQKGYSFTYKGARLELIKDIEKIVVGFNKELGHYGYRKTDLEGYHLEVESITINDENKNDVLNFCDMLGDLNA